MVRGFRVACAGALAAFAVTVLPASAGAVDAVSVYGPDSESRTFGTSPGGFTAEDESSGLCVPVLLCPAVDNVYVASGGTMGPADGFLRTEIMGLTGVAGETRAMWTGPPFVYAGAANQAPTELVATVSHSSTLGALLNVVGNSADYTVELIDESASNLSVPLIQGSLAPTQGWTRSGLVQVNPTDLTIGHTYRFQITSRFVYGAQVAEGGNADYDDLALIATRVEAQSGNDDDDDRRGDNRPGGNNAIFDGRRLFIKLRCFGEQDEDNKCFSRATALKTKKGARYTFPIQRVVEAKKGKVIRARVRFQFRNELENRKFIILKSVLRGDRVDKKKTVKFKKLRLIDRSQDD